MNNTNKNPPSFENGFSFGASVHKGFAQNTSKTGFKHSILHFCCCLIEKHMEEYIMSNIIEDFYYGNIEPQDVNSELTPKLKKKLSNLAEKEEQLTARLAGEDKELFQNYISAYIEFSITSNADSFISGFRLGAKFIYDTFVKNTKG